MNLYDISIPPMARTVAQARKWLDKAQAYAEQTELVSHRIALARADLWRTRYKITERGRKEI
jgi:hypothetical protein